MTDDIFKINETALLLERQLEGCLRLTDAKSAQQQFMKILFDQDLLRIITKLPKTVECLAALITIGSACKSHGLLLSMGAHCFAGITALQNFSDTDEQKEIRDTITNGSKIVAFAATEMNAGSDVMAMQTQYVIDDNKFIINGKKCFITNATSADYFLTFATKNIKLYDRGLSLFLIPKNTLGITIEPLDTENTLKQSGLGNVIFDNVILDQSNLVGKECRAATVFRDALQVERGLILVSHIGTMLRWYNQSMSHVTSRTQFKKRLYQFQNVSNKIIEMHERIKLSYLLAKDLLDQSALSDVSASMTKNFISESLQICHKNALNILGAHGILGDKKIHENLLDSFSASVYSGTDEMQKNIIINSLIDNYHENIN